MKIFTVGDPFAKGGYDRATLEAQAAEWAASQAIDKVLIGYSALWPQNIVTASMIFEATKDLGLIVAHRPGVMHPAVGARMFGTMDALSGGGRLAINIVSGSSDKDLAREGDYLPKEERYDRAADYIEVMTRCWSESSSFDHESRYSKVAGVRHLVRPMSGHVPIFMGGDSDAAVDFGARMADVYMLWGEPLAGTKERIARVSAAAEEYGRKPEYSLSLRLFLADTDEEAWEKARVVEQAIVDSQGTNRVFRSSADDKSVGRSRQLETAKQELHDDCYWTRLTELLGGFANSGALVGTPDRVLAAMAKYRDLGVDAFLLTTGIEGYWEPSLEEFACRVKREL